MFSDGGAIRFASGCSGVPREGGRHPHATGLQTTWRHGGAWPRRCGAGRRGRTGAAGGAPAAGSPSPRHADPAPSRSTSPQIARATTSGSMKPPRTRGGTWRSASSPKISVRTRPGLTQRSARPPGQLRRRRLGQRDHRRLGRRVRRLPGPRRRPAAEATLTTLPRPCAVIDGSTAFIQRTCPR